MDIQEVARENVRRHIEPIINKKVQKVRAEMSVINQHHATLIDELERKVRARVNLIDTTYAEYKQQELETSPAFLKELRQQRKDTAREMMEWKYTYRKIPVCAYNQRFIEIHAYAESLRVGG